jgi:hypothetical protein
MCEHQVYIRQGDRMARERRRFAASQSANSSFTGSHFNDRPVQQAMLAR